ncbi:MAG: Smr/MutS family protein [Novosphingobium sp.]
MRRRLSPEEAAIWAKVASSVTPIKGRRAAKAADTQAKDIDGNVPATPPKAIAIQPSKKGRVPPPLVEPPPPLAARPLDHNGLDGSWERKLARGILQPDFTLDLHGATLDSAYMRLEHGLTQALAQGARVVLLITGRPRPSDGQAGRGERRGAIRAKFLDWLSAGSHSSRIAAIRPAHPRHGGAGAVYIVLRRPR